MAGIIEREDGVPVEQGHDDSPDASWRKLPRYTPQGFEMTTCPEWAYQEIGNVVVGNTFPWVPEALTLDEAEAAAITRSRAYSNEPFLFVKRPDLKALHHALLPMHEAWAGVKLKPSIIYGPRMYREGARLARHTDREATHHISSNICVAQRLLDGTRWPLSIEDHEGGVHEFDMQPGDLMLYEGAKLPHWRATPLHGWYIGIFLHYQPA